jgi:hypothetical protein
MRTGIAFVAPCIRGRRARLATVERSEPLGRKVRCASKRSRIHDREYQVSTTLVAGRTRGLFTNR